MARPMDMQGNLFTLDSPLIGEILGERTVAEFPFFALKKARQLEPMTFQAEGVSIEVSSGNTELPRSMTRRFSSTSPAS